MPDLDDMRFQIARLECRRGDTLVVKSDSFVQAFSAGRTDHIFDYFALCVPEGVRIMLIDSTTELSILSPAAEPAKDVA